MVLRSGLLVYFWSLKLITKESLEVLRDIVQVEALTEQRKRDIPKIFVKDIVDRVQRHHTLIKLASSAVAIILVAFIFTDDFKMAWILTDLFFFPVIDHLVLRFTSGDADKDKDHKHKEDSIVKDIHKATSHNEEAK